MPKLVEAPVRGAAVGTPPKTIEEFVGGASSGDRDVSIARMRSPSGWSEPGQRPEFDEFTVVLRGALRVEHEGGALDVRAGQAVIAHLCLSRRRQAVQAGKQLAETAVAIRHGRPGTL